MCTTIFHQAPVSGSGKGPQGWFELARVQVGYDHPFRAPYEHAVSIDFVDEAAGTRLAVELSRESARAVAERILATLEQADAYEDRSGGGEVPPPEADQTRTGQRDRGHGQHHQRGHHEVGRGDRRHMGER